MERNKVTHDLHEQILDRLASRKGLAETAVVIAGSDITKNCQFFQEREPVGTCLSDADQKGNKNVFICDKYSCPPGPNAEHACPDPFDCDSERRTFNCGPENNDNTFNCEEGGFQCNQTDTPTFSCEHGGSVADYFDCRTFDCGVVGSGQSEKFDCNSIVDFECGDVEDAYICVSDFDCTAGHVFACHNDHACDIQFACSGGTVEGCTEGDPPVVQAVSCTPGPNVNGYSPQPGGTGGDGNNNPGDFLCGHYLDDADQFDCRKNFDCKANSDFSCVNTAEFTCAQQGGGDNDFQCSSKSPFECFSGFTCASSNLFKCTANGDPYKCKSSYALCKSSSVKECMSKYKCPKPNNCVAPDFNCSQSGTNPPFTCVTPFGDPGA